MRCLIPAFLALACVPAVLFAQEVVQPLPGTTDADRLAEQMRALAANPRDVNALLAAGDLSLGLDDLSGAASLYARAEKVSPGNPRVKAGEGSILVRSERPGEALRYFAQAEAAGLDARSFAADRGLAYDLIGEQERAQRDYRLALKNGGDAEVAKRYALSLGISGKREAALQQLDPLLRTPDRSAWRIRAFVLAMGGDVAGAEKIAVTMLPPGMAQGLAPFFQRLPTLPAADRAFAVHFGEVHSTPERLADARLVPTMVALAPEPQPVMLAAADTAPVGKKDRRRDRAKPGRVALASAGPVAVGQVRSEQAGRAGSASMQVVPPPVALAQVEPLPSATPPVAAAARAAPNQVTMGPRVAQVQPLPGTANQPVGDATLAHSIVQAVPAPTDRVVPSTMASAAATPGASSMSPASVNDVSQVVAAMPTAGFPSGPVRPATPAATLAVAKPLARRAPLHDNENQVLARIIAGLSIPASELGVGEPAKPVVIPVVSGDDSARVLAEAKAKEERDAAAERLVAAKTAADKRAADRKAAADKKALAAKKAADAQKLADAEEAAEAKKAARANPARIWVQVAGGANEGDLAKAWATTKAKAPTVFAGHSGWTTPLRATNRVLTGPFKTEAEARAFVNQLTKAGVSSFSFSSDAGQPVTKLPAK